MIVLALFKERKFVKIDSYVQTEENLQTSYLSLVIDGPTCLGLLIDMLSL